MQLAHLQAFVVLANERGFRRAAARLYVSQPTLSAQIAELERDLGVRLFDRDRSGTRLSENGRDLLPTAQAAVHAAAGVELAARHSRRFRRRFAVGLTPYAVGALTWPLLQEFHAARPDLELVVLHVGFAHALPALRSGRVDVVLAIGPFGEEDGAATTVGAVDVVAIMPAGHPRSGCPSVELDWLATHLCLRPRDGMGRTMRDFWTLQHVGARPVDRLPTYPEEAGLPDMLGAVERGVVGPWPAAVPVAGRVATVPLASPLSAPLQILRSHDDRADAGRLGEIATALAGAAAG